MFLHKISEKELSAAIKNLKNKYSSDFDGHKFVYSRKYSLLLPDSYLIGNQMFWKQHIRELLKEGRSYSTV